MRGGDNAVTTSADGVHGVRVGLTAAGITEETLVVSRPTLDHLAAVVHGLGHVVVGVVGGLPGKFDHVAAALTLDARLSGSAGDWGFTERRDIRVRNYRW